MQSVTGVTLVLEPRGRRTVGKVYSRRRRVPASGAKPLIDRRAHWPVSDLHRIQSGLTARPRVAEGCARVSGDWMKKNLADTEHRTARSQRVLSQLSGASPVSVAAVAERRHRFDRRRLTVWSVVYGGFRPRRRKLRRIDDASVPVVDWHESHLLAVSLFILLLCCADAFLTLSLLMLGADEANPLMARLINFDVTVFAVVKMALTGGGVLVLVLLSQYRVFGRFRVAMGLYATLIAYSALVVYELILLVHLS